MMPQEKDALVGNAGDAEQVKKAKETEKQREIREASEMAWFLSDPRGINVMRRILVRCGLFKLSFTGNSTTFFNEGMRDVGLWLSDEALKVNPQAYLKAIQKEEN